jgi:hypothetical protein
MLGSDGFASIAAGFPDSIINNQLLQVPVTDSMPLPKIQTQLRCQPQFRVGEW